MKKIDERRIGDLKRAGFLGLMVGIVLGILITLVPLAMSAKVEAAQVFQVGKNETRFQLQYEQSFGNYRLSAVCDTANGDLIYLTHYNAGYGDSVGIETSRDRCQKNGPERLSTVSFGKPF